MRSLTIEIINDIIGELYKEKIQGRQKQQFVSQNLRFVREYCARQGDNSREATDYYWKAISQYNSYRRQNGRRRI